MEWGERRLELFYHGGGSRVSPIESHTKRRRAGALQDLADILKLNMPCYRFGSMKLRTARTE